jgi:hypothetical protein
MKKALNELLTYIWIPFTLGLVFYVFRDLRDIPLAVTILIAFSAVYVLVRLYFAHKHWWLLLVALLVALVAGVFALTRPQGIILTINGQAVTGSSVSFAEGSVLVSPAPTSDDRYAKDTVVSLTAIAGSGYDWKSWAGTGGDTSNPATVTMGSSKEVKVVFQSRYSLIIGNQMVVGSGIDLLDGSVLVNPAPGEDGKYAKDTVVSLTATAGSGYDWKNWTGTDGDASNPTTVTMSGNKQVTVVFQPRFTLSINNQLVVGSTVTFPEGTVTVDKAPADDDKYAKGTVVSLTATPAPAYGLKSWAGTSNDASNPTSVTIGSDKHVTVIFELRFTLTVNNQPVTGASANFTEGLVSLNPPPLADARYAKDTPVTLTAVPAEGYRFVRWEGDASGNATSVSITLSSAKNVTATFKKVYTFTTLVSPVGSGSISPGGGTYDEGAVVTLTAVPASGYRFLRWEGDASGNATSVSITLSSAKSVTATFKKVYTLTTLVSPVGSGSVSPGGGTYDEGAVVTLTAVPASGYRLDRWEGDVSGNMTSANITLSSAKNVTALFVKVTP